MRANSIFISVLFLTFFISTGFIFSNHSINNKDIQLENDFLLQDTSKTKKNDKIYTIVDRSPSFKGGMDNFYKYIAKNLKYPKTARENGIEGRVFVVFIVDKKGNIVDAKVVKGVNPELDAEALRVVENSPKWIPALKDGKKVKVRMNIPINFVIDKEKN